MQQQNQDYFINELEKNIKKFALQSTDAPLKISPYLQQQFSRQLTRSIPESVTNQDFTILTNSSSSTVSNSLIEFSKYMKEANRFNLHIIVCESRPALEGLNSATNFCKQQIKTSVICDAAIGSLVVPKSVHCQSQLDGVVIGSDCVVVETNEQQQHEIYIVNKTGSLYLSMVAKMGNLPIFILCDTTKITFVDDITAFKDQLEQGEANELLSTEMQNLGISAINPTFELIPFDDTHTVIISEKGVLKKQDVIEMAAIAKKASELLELD